MTNEERREIWIKQMPLVMSSIIVATALIIAAALMQSTAGNGAIYTNQPPITTYVNEESEYQLELMDIDGLLEYLVELYPITENMDGDYYSYSVAEDGSTTYSEDYLKRQEEKEQYKAEITKNIVDEEWTDFPYIKRGDQLLFRKKAVREWFDQQSKKQFDIGRSK